MSHPTRGLLKPETSTIDGGCLTSAPGRPVEKQKKNSKRGRKPGETVSQNPNKTQTKPKQNPNKTQTKHKRNITNQPDWVSRTGLLRQGVDYKRRLCDGVCGGARPVGRPSSPGAASRRLSRGPRRSCTPASGRASAGWRPGIRRPDSRANRTTRPARSTWRMCWSGTAVRSKQQTREPTRQQAGGRIDWVVRGGAGRGAGGGWRRGGGGVAGANDD